MENLVCEECGGNNIQALAWVNANTNKYEAMGNNDENDRWYIDCDEHVNFILKKDYEK